MEPTRPGIGHEQLTRRHEAPRGLFERHASLEFNLEALRKLAERGLSKEDVVSLLRADQVVWTQNPNPRAEHSRYVTGPTPDGRVITVVVDRDTDDHGRWHVMTAWDGTPAQVAVYRRAR